MTCQIQFSAWSEMVGFWTVRFDVECPIQISPYHICLRFFFSRSKYNHEAIFQKCVSLMTRRLAVSTRGTRLCDVRILSLLLNNYDRTNNATLDSTALSSSKCASRARPINSQG